MFNGIIKNTGRIISATTVKGGKEIIINTKMKFKKKDLGSSVSCSGACLTVTAANKKNVKFYLSNETLKKTNFNNIKSNSLINLEKPLKFGEPISGHFVQGHIDTTGQVNKIDFVGKSWNIKFAIQKKYKKYLVYKGSITINGVSLTVSRVLRSGFITTVIPHTLKLTNLIKLRVGDKVNIEFDILSKYLKN
tara:strand:- start:116 stop:691 length:576 start_codon:yes stop_codon:yes gene_type:complete